MSIIGRVVLLTLVATRCHAVARPSDGAPPRLRISENQRFLATADGPPFFWLGNTAWELFHRLDRGDADRCLDAQANQGLDVLLVLDDAVKRYSTPGTIGCRQTNPGVMSPRGS